MKLEASSDARRIILSRIRSALLPQVANAAAGDSWERIPREYRSQSASSRHDVLKLFVDRLRDYDAQVLQCEPSGVAHAVEQMVRARGVTSMLVPGGFPREWLPAGVDCVRDEELTAAQLDACLGVITTCTLGIAETGTIVLQNAAGQGRRALSLVPDYHLCVVDAGSVVATVPEALSALQATALLPTTFISGPSATADIEMTRIKGVHGPRFLDIVLISSEDRIDKAADDGAV